MSKGQFLEATGLAAAATVLALLGATPGDPHPRPLNGYVLAGNQGSWVGLFSLDGRLQSSTRLSAVVEPRGACIAPDGSIYVVAWAERPSKNLFRLSAAGVEVASFSVVDSARRAKTVAAAPGGDLILAFMNENRLTRFRPQTNSVVWDQATGLRPRGIAVAGDGAIWVAAKGGNVRSDGRVAGSLVRHRADGRIEFEVVVPLGARGVDVDGEGNCWVAILGQQTGVPEDSPISGDDHRVLKLSPTGKTLAIAEVGLGPFAVACDVHGSAFVACARDDSVWKLRPDGSPDPVFGVDGRVDVADVAPRPLSLALDGEGDVWVASNYEGLTAEKRPVPIVRLDGRTGRVRQGFPCRFPHAVRPEALGDLCGYHLASVIDPEGDLDHDGQRNREELLAGSNPFDPQSRHAKDPLEGGLASHP